MGELKERASESPDRRGTEVSGLEGDWLRGVKLLRLKTALHTLKWSPQNSFRWIAYLLGHLMPSMHYMFIPFLRRNSQLGQTKIGPAKNRIRKTNRTNIIATNFVWEQFNTNHIQSHHCNIIKPTKQIKLF